FSAVGSSVPHDLFSFPTRRSSDLIVFIALGPNFMDENNPSKMTTTMLFVMIPGFILYFAKDSLKGISVGKWIMGIMVRDENDQRSEEHTSELQSREKLVCRLLLE